MDRKKWRALITPAVSYNLTILQSYNLTLHIKLYVSFSDSEGRIGHPGVLRPAGEVPPIVLILASEDQLGGCRTSIHWRLNR